MTTKTDSFEARLYEELKTVIPHITTRQISKAMGKTEGYFSSVTTQKLEVSVDSLVHLHDFLECRKVLAGHQSSEGIRNVQKTIAEEVLSRIKLKTENSGDFWELLQSQMNASTSKPMQTVEPLPFSWTRY